MSYSKNVAINVVSQAMITATTFLTTIFTTRILADVGRGEWALYTNFISLAVLFFGFSLTTGLVYQLSSRNLEPYKAVKIGLVYSVGVATLFGVCIFGLFSLDLASLLVSRSNQTSEVLVVCILNFFLTTVIAIFASIFNGLKKIMLVNMVAFTFSFAGLVFFVIFYFSGHSNVLENAFLFVIKAQVVVQILQFCTMAFFLLRQTRFRDPLLDAKISKDEIKMLFGYSTLIYLTNLVSFFTYKLDFWFVDHYVGKAGLGVYSIAVMLVQLVWLLPNAIALINLTEVSHDPVRGVKKTVESFKLAGILSILIAATFWVVCKLLIPSIYGSQFSEVPNYMLFLFIGAIPFAPISIISAYFAGINRYVPNLVICLIGVMVCVLLDILLIPKYGILGACIASSVSYLVIAVLLVRYFSKISRASYREIFFLDRHFILAIYQKAAAAVVRYRHI